MGIYDDAKNYLEADDTENVKVQLSDEEGNYIQVYKKENVPDLICNMLGLDDIDQLSDGFHTFNSLYDQRRILFTTLVNIFHDWSWKSKKHSDGKLCFGGGWFIVCIETPEGSYSYHYEEKYYDDFHCKELEYGKPWDGHTDKDVSRLLSLADTNIIYYLAQKSFEMSNDKFKWKDANIFEPKDFNCDWVLVKTKSIGKDSVPYVAEKRNGKWYTREDVCLDSFTEVTHWKIIYDEFVNEV